MDEAPKEQARGGNIGKSKEMGPRLQAAIRLLTLGCLALEIPARCPPYASYWDIDIIMPIDSHHRPRVVKYAFCVFCCCVKYFHRINMHIPLLVAAWSILDIVTADCFSIPLQPQEPFTPDPDR